MSQKDQTTNLAKATNTFLHIIFLRCVKFNGVCFQITKIAVNRWFWRNSWSSWEQNHILVLKQMKQSKVGMRLTSAWDVSLRINMKKPLILTLMIFLLKQLLWTVLIQYNRKEMKLCAWQIIHWERFHNWKLETRVSLISQL